MASHNNCGRRSAVDHCAGRWAQSLTAAADTEIAPNQKARRRANLKRGGDAFEKGR